MPDAATLTPRGTPVSAAHIPTRSSKVSEKLVLLPETTEDDEQSDGDEDEDEDAKPPDDEEVLRRKARKTGKSRAERLPKSQRTAEAQLARVTAYTTAQSYKLRSMATFVKDQHGAKTKLYDDCLYCVYQLPLLGGSDGYRVRSSPVVKNPGGRSILDEQIEANERREYREGWRDESDEYSVVGNESYNTMMQEQQAAHQQELNEAEQEQRESHFIETNDSSQEHGRANGELRRESTQSTGSSGMSFPPPGQSISPDAHTVAELFIFSYGVAVFWNFTSNQEKDLLADLTFSSAVPTPSSSHSRHALSQKTSLQLPTAAAVPLLTRPLDEGDFETEEFHFEYDEGIEKARIYNDMITLRTSDHMIKLAMSHAIGQSTKLSFFEERMQRTMAEAQYVPKQLALEGRLGMSRAEVVALVGSLFEGRVDVNLCKSSPPVPCLRTAITNNIYSKQHAGHTEILLGLRAYSAPLVSGCARIPGNQATHPSAQRTLPRLPGPRRDSIRPNCRRQDDSHHVDHNRPDHPQYSRHIYGSNSTVRYSGGERQRRQEWRNDGYL